MAVPSFQEHMLPTLLVFADGKEKHVKDIREDVANRLQLTPEDRAEMTPGGSIPRYADRVNWSVTYFKQAQLIESTRRGYYKLATRGAELLQTNPSKIDIPLLMQYPEYAAFRNSTHSQTESNHVPIAKVSDEASTPQELIDMGYKSITEELSASILSTVKQCSPEFFERLVVDLLLAMGYGGSRQEAGSITRKGSDEGIDGVINEDRLGLDVIYVQAKRWDNTVSRPEIQKFAGALQGMRATKGIFITTSSYSKDAHEYTNKITNKIVLIDGDRLSKLMIEHNVGVACAQVYEIKKIDSDYFSEV
ncbi:MAG: restriction endonuclease [Humidesulfovibrio sp.]|nr:restriction endonuclease [Humidesulfovibrio sp.]